jgi:hypothetical protein
MAADAIEDDLARRFRIDRPPTLLGPTARRLSVPATRPLVEVGGPFLAPPNYIRRIPSWQAGLSGSP